jgi:hypothetical protein
MGEGEPGVDLNSPKDNSMTLSVRLVKGGHGTSLFLFCRRQYLPAGRQECRRYIIYMQNCSVPIYRGQGRRGDL